MNTPQPQRGAVALRPVRFIFKAERVKTVEELAIVISLMGMGVLGPDGYEALVANKVDHLFERETHSQIVSPGVVPMPNLPEA